MNRYVVTKDKFEDPIAGLGSIIYTSPDPWDALEKAWKLSEGCNLSIFDIMVYDMNTMPNGDIIEEYWHPILVL